MASPIPPRREPEFVPWLTNLHTRVVAEVGSFGVPADVVTAWTAAYTAFIAANTIATDPETRTKAAIRARRDRKRDVMAHTRHVMGIIQAMPTVTDEQRVLLGLHVRDREITPIHPPTEVAVLEVVAVNGWTAKARVRSTSSEVRGKPAGVAGFNIYTFVGDEPPTDVDAWKFEGDSSKTTFEVAFPATLAVGTKVWLTVCWKNPRFQTGPACAPVGVLVGGGVPTLAQAA